MHRLINFLHSHRSGLAGVAIAAIAVGGILLVITAIHRRRYGAFRLTRPVLTSLWVGYGLALLAVAAFPLPDRAHLTCVGHNLTPLGTIGPALSPAGDGPHVGQLLQAVANVALFAPLGILARRGARRGILLTVAVGLAVSGLIEATQFTGTWWAEPCAYRYADADDLLANTLGALVGWGVAGRRPPSRPDHPAPEAPGTQPTLEAPEVQPAPSAPGTYPVPEAPHIHPGSGTTITPRS